MLSAAIWFWVAFPLFAITSARKNLIIDTDLFSDCDDAGALLLASTSADVNLLGVNINSQSSYSVLATSAILSHYGHSHVPVGARRPLNDVPFFDNWGKRLGEFASKLATHWPKTLSDAEEAWDPVKLYRKLLAEADDGSVTIASIGFLHNLSGLLNSTADAYSSLDGPDLVKAKVKELVVMGGDYPNGFEFNFWGDNPCTTAQVIHNWKGPVVYVGFKLGGSVYSGGPLMADGPKTDPVRAAYILYSYYQPRWSFDPIAVLYAIGGLATKSSAKNWTGYSYWRQGPLREAQTRLEIFPNLANALRGKLQSQGPRMRDLSCDVDFKRRMWYLLVQIGIGHGRDIFANRKYCMDSIHKAHACQLTHLAATLVQVVPALLFKADLDCHGSDAKHPRSVWTR
ncbi:hypothetical protein EsH8_IV_000248 [Colletotrichum jinshuiense]